MEGLRSSTNKLDPVDRSKRTSQTVEPLQRTSKLTKGEPSASNTTNLESEWEFLPEEMKLNIFKMVVEPELRPSVSPLNASTAITSLSLVSKECNELMKDTIGVDLNLKRFIQHTYETLKNITDAQEAEKRFSEIKEAILKDPICDKFPVIKTKITKLKLCSVWLSEENKRTLNKEAFRLFQISLKTPINTYRKQLYALVQYPEFNVNEVDWQGNTLFHLACGNCDKKLVEILLSKNGIDVNQANKAGWTPFHYACCANVYEGCKELVELLLKQKKLMLIKQITQERLLFIGLVFMGLRI